METEAKVQVEHIKALLERFAGQYPPCHTYIYRSPRVEGGDHYYVHQRVVEYSLEEELLPNDVAEIFGEEDATGPDGDQIAGEHVVGISVSLQDPQGVERASISLDGGVPEIMGIDKLKQFPMLFIDRSTFEIFNLGAAVRDMAEAEGDSDEMKSAEGRVVDAAMSIVTTEPTITADTIDSGLVTHNENWFRYTSTTVMSMPHDGDFIPGSIYSRTMAVACGTAQYMFSVDQSGELELSIYDLIGEDPDTAEYTLRCLLSEPLSHADITASADQLDEILDGLESYGN